MDQNETYLTTDQLAERIHYDARTIRTRLKDAVLLEGVHYIRPFGGRKLLFIWEAIQRDIGRASATRAPGVPLHSGGSSLRGVEPIPMANGVVIHG